MWPTLTWGVFILNPSMVLGSTHGFIKMYVVVVGFVMYGTDSHTILPKPVDQRQITRLGGNST